MENETETNPYLRNQNQNPSLIDNMVGGGALICGIAMLVTDFDSHRQMFAIALILVGVHFLCTNFYKNRGCYYRRTTPHTWWGNLEVSSLFAGITILVGGFFFNNGSSSAMIMGIMLFVVFVLKLWEGNVRVAYAEQHKAQCTCVVTYETEEQFYDYHTSNTPLKIVNR